MEEYYQPPRIVPHPFWRIAMQLIFKVFYFLRIEGREKVPPEGPLLIASNHQSYLDPLIVGLGIPHPVAYMAWAALFRGPRWFARLIHRYGAFPVDIDKTDPASFRLAMELLRQGQRVVIFPEGGRQTDGRLMEMREGAARLALHTRVTILPVRIEGAWAVWPKPRKYPSIFKPIKITIGEPIRLPDRRLAPPEREAKTREIMERLKVFFEPEAGK